LVPPGSIAGFSCQHCPVRNTTVGVCAVLVAALLSACSGSSATHADQLSASSPTASASAGPVPIATDISAPPDTAIATDSGTNAGLRLEALLGQHSILAADMMRARVRSDADLAQSANAALGQNTAALGDLLQPVIGTPVRKQFEEMWGEHIQALFNYSRGLATHDAAVRKDAREELIEYEGDLAGFFAAQSHGRLSRATALAAVQMHIAHLLAGADAYAAKDYVSAAKYYRLSYSHTFDLGATLAHALLPVKVAKALDSPSLQLRSALTKLLGEHVALVIAAMRSAEGDQNDFKAMGDAVNGNTVDLTAAIDSLFGATAAKGFQSHWADHVDQLMAYTSAAVQGDAAGQEKARVTLRSFEQSFASFLNTATQNRLGQAALAQTFVMHDRMLLAEIDAYAAKSYQQAQDLSYQTYTEMFTVSGQLANAIGATLAGKLPRGGSQTGGGGLAGVVAGR
jgi:hypothetical protein